MGEVKITRHGAKRMRQRLGVPLSAVKRCADKALHEGVCHADATGHLAGYISKLYNAYGGAANNIRVYNEHVYIFNNSVLITILTLPGMYRKQAKYQQHRLRRNIMYILNIRGGMVDYIVQQKHGTVGSNMRVDTAEHMLGEGEPFKSDRLKGYEIGVKYSGFEYYFKGEWVDEKPKKKSRKGTVCK